MPTYDYKKYILTPTYSAYSSYLTTAKDYANVFTYSSFYYKGTNAEGSCADWRNFYGGSLETPFTDVYFSKIYAFFNYDNYQNKKTGSVSTFCNNQTVIAALLKGVKSGSSYSGFCNGNTWKTFQCSGNSIICINCRYICDSGNTCPTTAYVMNPCSQCNNVGVAGSVLAFQYSEIIYYPEFTYFNVSAVSKTSITIQANLTTHGRLYCTAKAGSYAATNATVMSTVDIKGGSQSVLYAIGQTGSVYLELDNLSPDTLYQVYCYSEDFAGHIMPVDTAKKAGHLEVKTSCCRSLQWINKATQIYEYSTTSGRSDYQWEFALDSVPTGKTSVQVTGYTVDCGDMTTVIEPSTIISLTPSRFYFTSASTSLSGLFTIRSPVACCKVQVATIKSNDTYSSISHSFAVARTQAQPVPPVVSSIRFSDDGTAVVVTFSASTNKGGQGSSFFDCSLLLTFPGDSYASCLWTSPSVLYAYYSTEAAALKVKLGDKVVVKAKSVKAGCLTNTNCNAYTYMVATSFNLSMPLSPIQPVPTLVVPTSIIRCNGLAIDATASTGKGSQNWYGISWNVYTSSNATAASKLAAWLNARYSSSIDVLVKVPGSQLVSGLTYTIELKLTNLLNQVGVARSVSYVSSSTATPEVVIQSPAVMEMYRSDALSVTASAVLPACSGIGDYSISYTWKVYKDKVYVSDIQSESMSPTVFKLSPYVLDNSGAYVIQVTAVVSSTTVTLTGQQYSTAAITINMGQSGVVASIAGGALRTLNTVNGITLDGSGSYDLDYPTDSSILSYLWSCAEYSPTFGNSCPSSVSSGGNNGATKQIGSSVLTPGTTYQFTLVVINNRGIVANASALITATEDAIPTMKIRATASKYNVKDKIFLTADINADYAAYTAWYSKELDISTVASTATTATLPTGSSIFQLTIKPDALVAGLSYTFYLAASYDGTLDTPYKIYKAPAASISITTNKGPAQGVIYATPTTGTALNTSFFISTASWVDDIDDYPLSYVFGYYTFSETDDYAIIRGKDVGTYVYSYLGVGRATATYTGYCTVIAYDVYSAPSSSASVSVVVTPLPSSSLSSAVTRNIDKATSLNDFGTAQQIVSAATSTVNVVDCLVTTPCSTLKRYNCRSTPRTCGACYDGFVGVPGDANTPCGPTIKKQGEYCDYGEECLSGVCSSSNKCTAPVKACANNCNSGGKCVYKDRFNTTVSTCYATDTTCVATCMCYSGKYGKDCSLTSTALSQAKAMREK